MKTASRARHVPDSTAPGGQPRLLADRHTDGLTWTTACQTSAVTTFASK